MALLLDAFGRYRYPESGTERDDGLNHLVLFVISFERSDETPVDLDLVELVVGQLGEAGIACSKVVESNPNPRVHQIVEDNSSSDSVLYDGALCHFQFDSVRGKTDIAQCLEDSQAQQPVAQLEWRHVE